MKEQTRGMFPVLWVAAAMLCIGLVPQLRADERTEPNESGWVQTNGPYGGEILTFYAAPKGVIFAGTEGAGIFRSTDRGNSWTPVNTGLHYEPGEGFTGVPALVQKGGTLYAGTRRTLYASTDGGNTWHRVSNFQKHESISGIVVIGDRIYVGTLNTGIWYSDDDGDSWQQVNDGFGPMSIRELSSIGTTLVAGTKGGVFRKRVDEDELTAINDDFIGHQVDSFAAMGNLLYVGGYIGNKAELFKSNDEGDSWIRITPKEMRHTVEALAVFGATLYAGTYGSGVFRSDDNGDTWTAVNDGLTDRTVSTLLVVNEDTVFAGTLVGGIFRTMDGGDSWMAVNTGLTNTSIGGLAVIGKTIYAGMSERFVYSVNGGESWLPAKFSSRPNEYLFSTLSVSDGELYTGAIKFAPRAVGGVFRLDNESNALVQVIVNRDLTGIQCLEIVGQTIYMGIQQDGVFQWEKDSAPWTTNFGLKGHRITALSVKGGNIYAGTNSGEIYRSVRAVKQWRLINPNMEVGSISGLKWVGSTLYATSWDGEGVFRSIDGGDSWTSISDGLGGAAVITIAINGTDIYVGTFGKGVFRWMEDKQSWKPIGSLPRQVTSLVVLDGFLYAG
ncbi:hypothetical protein C6503_19730, partial [Candidatus Poribacteria bacterium]